GAAAGATEDVSIGGFLSDIANVGGVALNPISALSGLADGIEDIAQWFRTGFTDNDLADALQDVADKAKVTADDVGLLEETFERFTGGGVDLIPFLEEFADAATLTDQELERF